MSIATFSCGICAAAGPTVSISGTLFMFSSGFGATSTALTASGPGIMSYLWTVQSSAGTGSYSLTGSTSASCTVNVSGNNGSSAVIRCTINGGSVFDEVTVTASVI